MLWKRGPLARFARAHAHCAHTARRSSGGGVQAKKEERRSVITGKVIKLKVKKTAADKEREANRKNLLQFLNAQYD